MRRYWAVRRQICNLIKDAVELGPFAVDPTESDVLCEAVARKIIGCGDAIAVLNEIFAARGIHLVEGPDGQWGWNGIRVRSGVGSYLN